MKMKKFFAAVFAAGCLTCNVSFAAGNDTTAPDPRVEKAVEWACEIAEDPIHGYSQGTENATEKNPYTGSREGALEGASSPDFDCSSLVYWAYQKGGFDIIGTWQKTNPEYMARYEGKQYSGDADTIWMDLKTIGGFKKFSWNKIKNNLMRGDILFSGGHCAIYIGNGKTVEARGVNNPKNQGHYETGDQGGEIDFYEAQGRNWIEVYRYVGK